MSIRSMAGRRVCITKAVAVVALLALLFAAGEAEQICNVDKDAVVDQCGKSCLSGNGKPSQGCCDALRHANFRCLCDKYWNKLKAFSDYAKCAEDIPSVCNIPEAKCR